MMRWLKHLLVPNWWRTRVFDKAALAKVEAAIAEAEINHSGEVCFAVEGSLSLGHLMQGYSPRQRAEEVFSQLNIWDTEQNNGVLIYLLMAERDVEVVVDRGAAQLIAQDKWQDIASIVENGGRTDCLVDGVIDSIKRSGALLRDVFYQDDSHTNNPNELPNAPKKL